MCIRDSRQSSGKYVHCEASVNSFICGLATAAIPIKPHTRRPAELVIVLQCSRLYLPQAATSASLKPVSYTHLDVYKRQVIKSLVIFAELCINYCKSLRILVENIMRSVDFIKYD